MGHIFVIIVLILKDAVIVHHWGIVLLTHMPTVITVYSYSIDPYSAPSCIPSDIHMFSWYLWKAEPGSAVSWAFSDGSHNVASTKHWPNIAVMLAQYCQQWTSFGATLANSSFLMLAPTAICVNISSLRRQRAAANKHDKVNWPRSVITELQPHTFRRFDCCDYR